MTVRTPNTYFQKKKFRPYGLKVRKLEFSGEKKRERGKWRRGEEK